MAFLAKKKADEPTLAERIDGLIEQYYALDDEADAIIDSWVDEHSRRCPGVPKPSLRAMEIDARTGGAYCHRAALERLRSKL